MKFIRKSKEQAYKTVHYFDLTLLVPSHTKYVTVCEAGKSTYGLMNQY